MIQIQRWDGNGAEACLDFLFQNFECTCEKPSYDSSQYMLGYPSTYYQPTTYDYQYHYKSYQDGQQQPLVVIINNEEHDNDWELYDIISLIASLNDKSNSEPVYIPYPVPTSCSDCNVDWDSGCYSDCGCRNKGKCNACNNDRHCCDCGCDDCERRKKGRPKSKSRSSDNCRCKSERGSSNRYDVIKHRCDCGY